MDTQLENGKLASGPDQSIQRIPAARIENGNPVEPQTLYSSFSTAQKMCLVCAASFSAMFSGLSSFIYYPAITALSRSLNASIESVNLTITSYLIVSGLAPSFLGDMADRMGRRPVSLVAFTIYFGANLGLALQHSYTALVILRCFQSAGASGTIAIAYGIISDISASAERGFYVGILMGFTNSAPCLGPVIGGMLTQKLSWHWVFWLLSILSGLHLIALIIFLPETSRKLVGDGSIMAHSYICRSLYSLISRNRSRPIRTGSSPTQFFFPNPLSCLSALFQKDNFIILVVGGLQYTIFGCLAASLSVQMIRIHSLNYLNAGLVYLPSGIGGILAALLTGKLLDYDYVITARKHGLPISKSFEALPDFPFEQARLRSVFPFLAVSSIATIGYGWALRAKTHIAIPLVMQFFTGSTQVAIFTVCGTLLTDLNPGRSATVQASYNIVRCALGAAGAGSLQAVINGVGVGWCFTIYALTGALSVPLFGALRHWGELRRRKENEKLEDAGKEMNTQANTKLK